MKTMANELDLSHAHINLIHYVLNRGGKISVVDPDCEGYDDSKLKSFGLKDINKVIKEVESWDGGQDFYVSEPDGDLDCLGTGKLYWVGLAIGYGNRPNESVYDYVVCPIIDDWFEQFTKEYGDE